MGTNLANPLEYRGHYGFGVADVFYSSDGSALLTASQNRLELIDGKRAEKKTTFTGHTRAIFSCCLDNKNELAASASGDKTARIWNAKTGEQKHLFQHGERVRACAFSKGGIYFLTGGVDNFIRSFDLNHPNKPSWQYENCVGSVKSICWLDEDRTFLCSFRDQGGVGLWDLRTGRQSGYLYTNNPVTSVELSRSENFITTLDKSFVRIWDVRLTEKKRMVDMLDSYVKVKTHIMSLVAESASLEPQTSNKFIASGKNWIGVFDYENGRELGYKEGEFGLVNKVKFSPDNNFFASGSTDGIVRIWDINSNVVADATVLEQESALKRQEQNPEVQVFLLDKSYICGPMKLPPVRDQGNEPLCVQYALTAALYCDLKAQGQEAYLGSVHHIHDTTTLGSLKKVKANGLLIPPTELEPERCIRIEGHGTIRGPDLPDRFEEIAKKIKRRPVIGGMMCDVKFRKFRKNYVGTDVLELYKPKGPLILGHAVLIIGYGTTNDGEKFFYIQNSFGKDWGYEGFAKVPVKMFDEVYWPINTHVADQGMIVI